MKSYPVIQMVDGLPCFEKPISVIALEAKKGGAIQVLNAVEFITDQQRRWYKGICLRDLVRYDENGETMAWWDREVKRQCNGLALLKQQVFLLDDGTPMGRLTTTSVGKKNMTAFIEEILSKIVELGWPISPPDKSLRR